MKWLRNLLTISLLACLINTSFAEGDTLKIRVNNEYIKTDVAPFITNGTTYVPIRFISEGLNVENISWNNDSKSVTLKKDSDTLRILINKNYAYKNGTLISIPSPALITNGRTFVPLRFVSENLNANVEWQESTNTVLIATKDQTSNGSQNNPNSSNGAASSGSTASTSKPNSSNSSTSNSNLYTNYDEAIYWLSRIIEAEASGEPLKGKIAVGEVILNRVRSDEFPNTIWSVIFDTKFGIQFEPVANGSIYNTPSADSIKAAKTALEGSNYVGKCLYFMNPTIAQSNWISKNRVHYSTIGNHEFYL